MRRSQGCPGTGDPGPKKFTEPVALSSTSPVNLRLPPTALGSGFGLLALRARCKGEGTASAGGPQGGRRRERCNLRKVLEAQRELAVRAACSKGDRTKIHRAGGAFVHLSREPSASAYGTRERLRSTHAPCSVHKPTYSDGQV